MIHFIGFTEDWRCFKADDAFFFRPGVNLLVGDQGCGKSSLFGAIQGAGSAKPQSKFKHLKEKTEIDCDPCKVFMFDFEHENPRTMSYFGNDTLFQVGSMFKSHGECNVALVKSMHTSDTCILLVDEPDTALSIRSCKLLVQQFQSLADNGSQVIAAVHNMAVIQAFDEVLSLEHRKWMSSAEFIASHLTCECCGCLPCGCGG